MFERNSDSGSLFSTKKDTQIELSTALLCASRHLEISYLVAS